MTQHIELIKEYRPTMHADVLHMWAKDARDALEAQAREIAGLQAARRAYASEFPPDGEGEPDVGSIHQNIRAMKAEIAELKAQESELCTLYGLAQAECKKLRAEVEGLRKDAERYRLLRECGVDSYEACGSGDKLDAECDAAIAMKGQP